MIVRGLALVTRNRARATTEQVAGLTSEQIGDLYRAHGRELLLFLARRTCDAQIALDLVSETFAQAVIHGRRFRGDSDEVARAWLFGIARRQLARYYRRGRVEHAALRRLGLDPTVAPDDELKRVEDLAGVGEVREALSSALREVGADQREALRLRVVEGQSYPEIAQALGVSEQTVRARVSRGLRTLRGLLDRRELLGAMNLD